MAMVKNRQSSAKIGVALGGGGAKGLAHILMLEALDELGLKPACIVGTSMGAIVGVLYCAGMKGKALRELLCALSIGGRETWTQIANRKALFEWIGAIDPELFGPALLKSEGIISVLFQSIAANTFEELAIPLRVVASDFWARSEVLFDKGPLRPAIQASMALPGVFPPVLLDGRVLIDGGATNPVPFDRLPEDCNYTIAIDVSGQRSMGENGLPSLTDAIFNTFQIMQKSIIREKLQGFTPNIYIEPLITDVRMYDFHRADEILKQAQPAKDELRRRLEEHFRSL